MGNCCFQPATSITSIEEHFSNNHNAEEQKPIKLQLVQAASVEQKEEELPEALLRIEDEPENEKGRQEQIVLTNKQPIQLYQTIIQLFALICMSYSNHDVDSCIPIIQRMNDKITIFCKETGSTQEDLQRGLQQYTKNHHQRLFIMFGNAQIFSLKTIEQIRRQHADILHYEQQIKSGNWEEKSNKKGSRLCTRNQGNSVGVLIQMDLELPFEILIAILTEIDLYPQFIAFNEFSRQEKIFSRNCRIGYNLNNYPFLSKREAFFQGIGYSRLKTHGQVFLFTRSIHDKPELQNYLDYKVKINPDYVQLTYKYFVVKYRPIRKGLGKLKMALNADIGLGFLPNFILEYLAKDFAEQFLKCILDIGKKFTGSQWEKKVQKNPALFDFFKKEIDEYINMNDLSNK